jgi:class 3 adenylate cyclase
MGDRDWHALLDAHDAVVRSQLARFRGREVNRTGDGFLAMFDGPHACTASRIDIAQRIAR